MKCVVLVFAVALLVASPIYAQNIVTEWFPSHVGDKWVYEHETRDFVADGEPLEVHRWETEETIVGVWPVAEGTLVERSSRILSGAPPRGWVNPERDRAYLIHAGCVYSDVDWLPDAHQLSQSFRDDLKAGRVAAEFCPPLSVGKAWGAPHWADWRPVSEAKDWKVVGVTVSDSTAPDKKTTFHITSVSSYLGSGMTGDIWFAKGVGIVREVDIHHGTPAEQRDHLLRFAPSLGRPGNQTPP